MACYDYFVKLLITGGPKSGKSTLLEDIITQYKGVAQGFITREIKKKDKRMGFVIVTSNNEHALLAQTQIVTDFPVGRFFVVPDNMSKVFERISNPGSEDLLYIDEIGQMQLLSKDFKNLLSNYLDSDKTLVATISKIYVSEEIESIICQPDSILFSLTESKRSNIAEAINVALKNSHYLNELPLSANKILFELAREYINDENFTSFYKLFNNAIHYLNNSKVKILDKASFSVEGYHGSHTVKLNNADHWECDCDLANGLKPYNKPSECSHYQAVLLLMYNI